MKNEFLNSEEAQKMIAEISEQLNPILVEGRTYHSEITRDEHGSSGGNISFTENGILHRYGKTGNYSDDEFSEHVDAVEDIRFRDLIDFFPVHSKIKFTLKKGEPVHAERFSVEMYLDEIKTDIENDPYSDKKTVKKELIAHFKQEADELGMFIDSTEYFEDGTMRSFDFMMNGRDLESIYHLVGGLQSFYFRYENGHLEAKSIPAKEEHGLSLLTIDTIEVEADYKKRQDAFKEGQKLRHEFFSSLGKLDDRIIYLRVGGFRDHSWPENSTSHNSCKMRVIHTPDTTILATDGLTDIYTTPHQDENLEYNGIGAEFYMEFFGDIPFEVMHKHFAMSLINSVSQIALGHGDIKKLMLSAIHVTVELKEEDVELWINRENNANHSMSSFLVPKKHVKGDSFAVMLGTDSKLVPQRVKMNLEEILMINIKPVDGKWLTKTKLRSNDDSTGRTARQEILKEWNDNGEMNLVPLTYQNEYVQGNPASGGMVLTPIFPF